MAKQTKRQRKFQATGGVQKRLEKGGTIIKKKITSSASKKHHRNKDDNKNKSLNSKKDLAELVQEGHHDTNKDDLMGHENLGNLDIDSFFAQFAPKDDDDDDDDDDDEVDDDEQAPTSNENNEDDDSDDDDDDGDDDESEDDDEDIEDDQVEDQEENIDDVHGENEEEDSDDDDDSDMDDNEESIEKMEQRMKKEMKKMQQSDPEFHTFLKDNEESLLEYNDDDDEEEEDDDDDDDDDDDTNQQKKKDKKDVSSNNTILVTSEMIKSLSKSIFQQHSYKAMKRFITIYKSACYTSIDGVSSSSLSSSMKGKNNSKGGSNNKSNNKNTSNFTSPYSIEPSSKVFDDIMIIALQKLHTEFNYHLLSTDKMVENDNMDDGDDVDDDDDDDDNNDESANIEEPTTTTKNDDEAEWNKPIQPKLLEKSERWNDMKQLLLSFYRSTLHLLMEVKENNFLTMICTNIKFYIRYLTPLPRISDVFLKTFITLWSAPIDTIEEYQMVRLNAFLRIRQLALLQPFPFIEECLKKTYLAYMKRAKFGSITIHSPTLPTLTFMGNCLVELYNIDYHSSYQHAFVYIRQLALLLRSVMQKKTIESMQQVYCWQYVQCIKLWVAVLTSAVQQRENESSGNSQDKVDMKSLIYPLIEIIMGTIRLLPSPVRHLPYRCHCIRLLHQLAASTELFIPTAALILDCFDWKEWIMVPKKTKESNRSSTRGVQLSMMIKFGKDDPLRTHDQLEAGMNELFLLLNREIDLYRYSPGFPEYAIRIIVRLRQFNKEIRNARWKTYIKACIELCDTYTTYAVHGRSKLQQAPRDVRQLECLKPISEKNMYERYTNSIRKEQATLDTINGISSTVTTVQSNRKSSRSKHDDSNDDNDEDEDGDGDDDDDDDTSNKKKRKQTKKKKKKKTNSVRNTSIDASILEDDQLMTIGADEVQDGIHWSDDDDDDK